jgi:hypothetical protein
MHDMRLDDKAALDIMALAIYFVLSEVYYGVWRPDHHLDPAPPHAQQNSKDKNKRDAQDGRPCHHGATKRDCKCDSLLR